MTLSPRVNHLLLLGFSLSSAAASWLIPPRPLARVVSTVFSGLVIVCATVEIRRARVQGPYREREGSIAPRQ